MKLAIFPLSLLLLISSLYAQNDPMKFGEIKPEEIQMKSYSKDIEAEAVILCEYNKVTCNVEQEAIVHKRIKIFKKDGYHLAQIEIPYYAQSERNDVITNIKASTYNLENGKLVEYKLEKKDILDQKVTEHRRLKKFALTNVKEGSIIEYTYTFNGGVTRLRPWYFQHDIPTIYSEFRGLFWEYIEHFQVANVFISPKIYDIKKVWGTVVYGSGNYKQVRIVLDSVPAMREEAFVANIDDYRNKVEYQIATVNIPGEMIKPIFSTWSKYIKDVLEEEDYSTYTRGSHHVSGEVKEAIGSLTDPKEKTKAIYKWVKSNLIWDGNYDLYPYKASRTTLKDRKGNSAEINLLLLTMLRYADIDATPVLCSTRSNGKVKKDYPLIGNFDHNIILVKIGNEEILLDAIETNLPFGMVSLEALNDEGLILKEDSVKWLQIKNSSKHVFFNNAQIDILEDGSLGINMDVSMRGYDANDIRGLVFNKGKEQFLTNYFKDCLSEGGMIISSNFENLENENEILKFKTKLTSNKFVEKNGDFIYLSPLLSFAKKENPFKAEERTFPIDFGQPSDEVLNFKIAIPKGYKIDEIPKSSKIKWENDDIKFDYNIVANTDNIVIVSKLSFKKYLFYPELYQDIKKMFEQIVAKQSEQIVFKKTN